MRGQGDSLGLQTLVNETANFVIGTTNFVMRTTPLQGRHSRAEVERLQNFVIGTTSFVNETTDFCYWTTNFVIRATNILLWDYKTENLSRGMI